METTCLRCELVLSGLDLLLFLCISSERRRLATAFQFLCFYTAKLSSEVAFSVLGKKGYFFFFFSGFDRKSLAVGSYFTEDLDERLKVDEFGS